MILLAIVGPWNFSLRVARSIFLPLDKVQDECVIPYTVFEMSVYQMWNYSILAHNTSKFVREHISIDHVNDRVRRARISDEHLITLKLIYKIYEHPKFFVIKIK